MGRNHGYVYYEADAFFNFANPFVDTHAEDPSMSTVTQKPLKVFRAYFDKNHHLFANTIDMYYQKGGFFFPASGVISQALRNG